jgi:hypothetical protein
MVIPRPRGLTTELRLRSSPPTAVPSAAGRNQPKYVPPRGHSPIKPAVTTIKKAAKLTAKRKFHARRNKVVAARPIQNATNQSLASGRVKPNARRTSIPTPDKVPKVTACVAEIASKEPATKSNQPMIVNLLGCSGQRFVLVYSPWQKRVPLPVLDMWGGSPPRFDRRS